MTTNTQLITKRLCQSKSIFSLASKSPCLQTDCACSKKKIAHFIPQDASGAGEPFPGSAHARPDALSGSDENFKRAALCLLIGLFTILSSLVGISTGLMLDDYNFSLQAILAMSLPVAILFFLFGFYLCRLVINYVFQPALH